MIKSNYVNGIICNLPLLCLQLGVLKLDDLENLENDPDNWEHSMEHIKLFNKKHCPSESESVHIEAALTETKIVERLINHKLKKASSSYKAQLEDDLGVIKELREYLSELSNAKCDYDIITDSSSNNSNVVTSEKVTEVKEKIDNDVKFNIDQSNYPSSLVSQINSIIEEESIANADSSSNYTNLIALEDNSSVAILDNNEINYLPHSETQEDDNLSTGYGYGIIGGVYSFVANWCHYIW